MCGSRASKAYGRGGTSNMGSLLGRSTVARAARLAPEGGGGCPVAVNCKKDARRRRGGSRGGPAPRSSLCHEEGEGGRRGLAQLLFDELDVLADLGVVLLH